MKRTIETWFICIAIMCTCMTSFAASPAAYSKNIAFRKTTHPEGKYGIGTFSLTEPDETIYGILTPDGVLTIDLAPVANDGAYITVYSEGEMVDYIYAADSVDIDFNEYGGEGNYTVTVTLMSESTEYIANIVL